MPVLFISDLHLAPACTEIQELFVNFLTDYQHCAKGLYILGDFFDTWIGDDESSVFIDNIIALLKQYTDYGIPVYVLHGNRDFLLGKNFFEKTGTTWLPDETIIDVNGIPTVIMHGDTLCTDDKSYLRFRKIVRSVWVQKLYLCLPLFLRRKIAAQLRSNSKGTGKIAEASMIDVNDAAVIATLKRHNVTQLIHGHTHRPAIYEFTLDNKPVKRIVLGAWGHVGSVLVCDKDAPQLLILR